MSSNPVNSQNMKLEVVVLPVSDVDRSQDFYKTLGCSNASANPYQAVSCSFYDELEALATLHRICTIRYRTETCEAVSIESQIIDLYTANKSEFLKLKDGTEIRLDRLISVDGKPVSFTDP